MTSRGGADGSQGENGSAVVDFVLVGTLTVLVFLAVVELALVLHVRNTLMDAAASGARYGILADRGPTDAKERTTELITTALGAGYARDVSVGTETFAGVATLSVSVSAPFPVLGLIGPSGMLQVSGHAALQP